VVWTVWDGMDGEKSPNHSYQGHGDGYDGVRGDGDGLQVVPEGVGNVHCDVDEESIAHYPDDGVLPYCDEIGRVTRGDCGVSDICCVSLCGVTSFRDLWPYSVAVSSGQSGRHLASRTLESDESGGDNDRCVKRKDDHN